MAKTIKKEAVKEENKIEDVSLTGEITEPGFYAFSFKPTPKTSDTYYAGADGVAKPQKLPPDVNYNFPIRGIITKVIPPQITVYADNHGVVDSTLTANNENLGYYAKGYALMVDGVKTVIWSNNQGLIDLNPPEPDPSEKSEEK